MRAVVHTCARAGAHRSQEYIATVCATDGPVSSAGIAAAAGGCVRAGARVCVRVCVGGVFRSCVTARWRVQRAT